MWVTGRRVGTDVTGRRAGPGGRNLIMSKPQVSASTEPADRSECADDGVRTPTPTQHRTPTRHFHPDSPRRVAGEVTARRSPAAVLHLAERRHGPTQPAPLTSTWTKSAVSGGVNRAV